jgi:WD40 repeat protein
MHQIRCTTPGVIKAILKKPGEAVRTYETVFQVQNLSRLRAEGLVDVQYLPRLRRGMRAVIEPCPQAGPCYTFAGHLQDITSVAWSPAAPLAMSSMLVSGSEDGTVRCWDVLRRGEQRVLRHPAPVLAVACLQPRNADCYFGAPCQSWVRAAVACRPSAAPVNLCLTGAADGKGRLWDLAGTEEPLRELQGRHAGAVTSVAISPDGRTCVTGGEDRNIFLWETASGALIYRFPPGHRGAVTSLRFTPQSQLVSAGRDQTLRLWTLGDKSARLEATFDRRSGEITRLDASPDGSQVLYDQGSTLRLLSLPEGRTQGVLKNTSEGANFTTFGLFSPDGRLILATDANQGRMQLWRAPIGGTRGSQVRQLVAPEPLAVTDAAWSPDGLLVAASARDRQLRVWSVPPLTALAALEGPPTGEVTLIEQAVETTTRQVRIWAELPNPEGRLLPGTTVTMVIE